VRLLRAIDIFQIATTGLFLALGAVIVVRAAALGLWVGCVVGAVMFAYGVHRSRAIVRALREVGR